MNYTQKTIVLILLASLVRSCIALSVGLGNDEVYYRMYAEQLQFNYFDHPPFVGWLIRCTTFNLEVDTVFFIRLGAIICAAITSWVFFLSGKLLQSPQVGFISALLYNCSIYGSIIVGTFILPDTPQMVFWSVAIFIILKLLHQNVQPKSQNILLVWFGVTVGLAMLCKIHSIFLWLGFILYIVLYHRSILKNKYVYVAAFISILIFLPVIVWNINNHFITYQYHGNRVNVLNNFSLNISTLVAFLVGQFFYTNPIVFISVTIATIAAFKNKLIIVSPHKKILLLLGLPIIIVCITLAFFKQVLPHWSGPGISTLILLSGCYLSQIKLQKAYVYIKLSVGFILMIIIAGLLVIHFYPGTIGSKNINNLGEGDFTLDLIGWKNLKKDVAEIIRNDEINFKMKPNAFFVSHKWFPAAHIDYYVAMPLHKTLVALGDTNDIHQYAWLNNARPKINIGDDAYCIVPSNNNIDVAKIFLPKFNNILKPDTINQIRNGKLCRQFYVWKLKGFKN